MKQKTAVLLINVGSPERPDTRAVWKYLSQFLNDKHVIDLPWLLRKILVNFIIIPLRVRKSTRIYQKLWNIKESPLIHFSFSMKEKLQEKAGTQYKVFIAMRYQKPDYKKAIRRISQEGFQRMVIFPLFPQYAMSTSGTAVKAVKEEIRKQKSNLKILTVDQFYDHPKFIQAFAGQAGKHDLSRYDHIVFSFHGLPNRHLQRIHPGIDVTDCDCPGNLPDHGRYCYRATCYATARLLARKLKIEQNRYSVSFQSRLSRDWTEPFTDKLLLKKLKEGKKRILVLAPSFVTDCLETLVEIGEEYKKMFLRKGGRELQLVESLNAEPLWIDAMDSIIREKT